MKTFIYILKELGKFVALCFIVSFCLIWIIIKAMFEYEPNKK